MLSTPRNSTSARARTSRATRTSRGAPPGRPKATPRRTVRDGQQAQIAGWQSLVYLWTSDRGERSRCQAHVKRWIDDLMPMVSDSSDPLGVTSFATHHLPLEQAPQGYEIFRNKDEGCIKVVLQP